MPELGGTVAVVPARGGSLGIPRKNLQLVGGQPLLCWSLDAARRSPAVDRCVVSTDDAEIADLARRWGADVHERPAELATAESAVMLAVKHALSVGSLGQPDVLVLLEPTSPFRDVLDIDRCVELVRSGDYDSCATFSPARTNPHRAWSLGPDVVTPFLPEADPWLPRQQLPQAWELNGNVYALSTAALATAERSFLVGAISAVRSDSWRALDIDDPEDLEFARVIAKQRQLAPPERPLGHAR